MNVSIPLRGHLAWFLFRFNNNTLVQHQGSNSPGDLWITNIPFNPERDAAGPDIPFDSPYTVFLVNELYVLYGPALNSNPIYNPAVLATDVMVLQSSDPAFTDPGFSNIQGTAPWDFDLVRSYGSAVDRGEDIPGNDRDFFNRTRKVGVTTDVGAFEYGATQEACIPTAGPFLFM